MGHFDPPPVLRCLKKPGLNRVKKEGQKLFLPREMWGLVLLSMKKRGGHYLYFLISRNLNPTETGLFEASEDRVRVKVTHTS